MKYLRHLFCLMMLAICLLPAVAQDDNHHDGEKKGIDLQEVLWGHIKDAYSWHIADIGGKPIVINLPVIVKTSTGWHFFCSSKFSHHEDEQGRRWALDENGQPDTNLNLYVSSVKDDNKIYEVVNGEAKKVTLDFSITKTVMVLFIDAIILILCILIPARWCKKHKVDDPAPKGFTGLVHMFVMYIYDDVIKPSLGKEADKYAPYLLTCFFFIFVANLMGVVPFPPGGGNLTGNITFTFLLALCTFIITNVTGTKAYWKDIFWPHVPTWLKVPVPLMPFIEFFSIFTKPLALMIRLFANMMAGHAIAISLTCIIFIMFAINAIAGTAMTAVSVAMSVFMMLLELLVCFIQALVFTMLSAVFISLAHVKEEHAVEKA